MKRALWVVAAFAIASCNNCMGPGGNPDGGLPDSGQPDGGDAGVDGGILDAGCGSLCAVDVLTYHNDNARTGQYLSEKILNQSNVNSSQFGKLFILGSDAGIDGKVDAQPLYMAGLQIPGKGTHNVLFVATEHASLLAFDADSPQAPLWSTSLLGEGEIPSDARGCDQVVPEIGVTSTPVIDPNTNTLYVVAMSKKGTSYFHRIHAIDIITGGERAFSPVLVEATYPGTGDNSSGGKVTFDPAQYKERSALLLLNGIVYTAWASHCDFQPYTSWMIAYDAATLSQRAVVDLVPNGSEGAIWGSGAGVAADESGHIFVQTGNGTFDSPLDGGFPDQADYGNAFVKLNGDLHVVDYFAGFDTVADSAGDVDLGSGGPLVLPDSVGNAAHPHLLVGAGKNPNIYLLDRDNLGHFNPIDNHQIVQELPGAIVQSGPGAEFGMPAYFNGAVYYGAQSDHLKRFSIAQGAMSTAPTSTSAITFTYPGTTPTISANGSAPGTAILWAYESTAALHAYSPDDLSIEFYNSDQAAGGRDHFGAGNKFMIPTVANGKVYVGMPNGVAVFGLRQ